LSKFSKKGEQRHNFKPGQSRSELQAIAVRALAQLFQGIVWLSALLRRLEATSRDSGWGFQASLPDNQALYTTKDIEAEGGWPYIERMKLQSFL